MTEQVVSEKSIIKVACSLVGCPYIWGGHGDTIWVSPDEGLRPIATKLGTNPHGPELGFDCAGLVTYSLWKAGGPNVQATHNAATMFEALPPLASGEPPSPFSSWLLHFYGQGKERISHIAFGYDDLVLEAAGGDGTTRTWQAAFSRGAKVRVGYALRSDYVGSRYVRDLTLLK